MAAARYWRLCGVDSWGMGDLVLSEVQLHDSAGRADGAATLTCTIAPATGAVADLQDGLLSSDVTWPRASYAAPGFGLTWDFGVDVDITAAVFGSGAVQSGFIESATLMRSSDGSAWTVAVAWKGILFPGPRATTTTSTTGGVVAATETFASDPAGQYTNTLGSNSVTWDSAAQALNVSGVVQQNFTKLNMFPVLDTSVDAFVEMDVKFVSDSANRKHFGFFLGDAAANGYRLAGLDNTTWTVSRWVNGVEQTPNLSATYTGAAPAFVVGSTYLLRASRTAGGAFSISVDGVLRFTSAENDIHTSLTAGVFCFGSAVQVLEVRQGALAHGGTGAAQARASTLPQSVAAPGLPATTGVTLQTHNGTLRDMYFGGRGRVRGTAKEKGTPDAPVYRRVRLGRERDGMVIREQWSDPTTGAYDFQYVDELQQYTVVAYDHLRNYRAVIADNLTPEIMPS